jgi:hypothetical protein
MGLSDYRDYRIIGWLIEWELDLFIFHATIKTIMENLYFFKYIIKHLCNE